MEMPCVFLFTIFTAISTFRSVTEGVEVQLALDSTCNHSLVLFPQSLHLYIVNMYKIDLLFSRYAEDDI